MVKFPVRCGVVFLLAAIFVVCGFCGEGFCATTFISAGSTWKYLDTGVDQGTGWRETAFADGGWAFGPAQLGYGDGDEDTLLSYGGDSNNKYPCYYFRHSFIVADASIYSGLKVRILRDDGAVVYLNGSKLFSVNMPETITYNTWALTATEYDWTEFTVPASALVSGTNVIAVEVHQANKTSTDVSFDLELQDYFVEHMQKGPYLIHTGSPLEMKVLWQVDVPQICILEWGLAEDDLIESTTATEVVGGDNQHEYVIGNDPDKLTLLPGTKYFYKVTDGFGLAYTGSFNTAPDYHADDLKFLAFGDTRANDNQVPYDYDSVCSEILDTIVSDPGYQTMILHVGDWNYGDTESDWSDMWFNRSLSNALDLHSLIPVMGCRGNHEGSSSVYYEKYYPYPYVDADENGTKDGFYFSFDYGPVHVAVVDEYTSYATNSAQHTWLDDDLANSNALWKFIVLHEPGWAAGGNHGDNGDVRLYIQPLCEAHGVDIVFGGHLHYYSRNVFNGVQHITTGGGGAPTSPPAATSVSPPAYPYLVVAEDVHQFCEIDIQGDTLYFTARRSNGTELDSFSKTISWPKASGPVPAAGAVDISSSTSLNWTEGVDAVSHDIYIGTDMVSVMNADTDSSEYMGTQEQGATSYSPGTLSSGVTYYWRIDEIDSLDGIAYGAVWSFTTNANPDMASNPTPTDPATGVAIDSLLEWQSSPARLYDVYLGTDAGNLALVSPVSPKLSVTNFDPDLNPGIEYFWAVDVFDNLNNPLSTGEVWSFTTASLPGAATVPNPSDTTATDVLLDAQGAVTLSWTAGTDTDTHTVLFGDSIATLVEVGTGLTAATFTTAALSYDSTYYWRVDEVGPGGTTVGADWIFETQPPPPDEPLKAILEYPLMTINPLTLEPYNINIIRDVIVKWQSDPAGDLPESHDVYFGTTSTNLEFKVNLPDTWTPIDPMTYSPGQLDYGTEYFWRIDTINSGGMTTGDVWSFTVENDTYEPVITYVMAEQITSHEATIVWTTDESSDSRVDFGIAVEQYGNDGTSYDWYEDNSADVTSHSIQLTGLEPSKSYHYYVTSIDDADNPAVYPDPADPAVFLSFTTLANKPPVVGVDSYSTSVDTEITMDVLGNDTDPDGDAIGYLLTEDEPPVPMVSQPANGVVIVNVDDTITYTPNAGVTGVDTFTYTISDGYLDGTVIGTVTVTVLNPYIDDVAVTEASVYSDVIPLVDGYFLTHDILSGDEVILEVPSSKNKNAYSIMDHRWEFDVIGGFGVSFHVNAYRDDYDTSEDFELEWSTNDVDYFYMMTVTKTDPDATYQTFDLPDTLSGPVFVRLVDTVHSNPNKDQNAGVLGTVNVDHMFIRSSLTQPVPDTDPPSPDPMTWEAVPQAMGSSSITMTATAATDENSIEYLFSLDDDSRDSGWQASRTYTDTGLDPDTTYTYKVRARDSMDNYTDWSAPAASATTYPAGVDIVMYVKDIAVEVIIAKKYYAEAVVTIEDEDNGLVAGATVVGDWYLKGVLRVSGATAITTLSGETEVFTSFETPAKSGDVFMFVVTNVVAPGYTYDPAQNVVDSGSDFVP